ncbi:cytochrome P450 [Aspergillus granulosus]|uniref:Cytochrome P450 n=1 Tax=Aspergillus granulosus TaxID=176169 RepID=A0ABR4I4D9_9EURO
MPIVFWAWSLLVVPLVYRGVTWYRNIREAKRTGLPYVLTPIHELEVWAYVTNPLLRWCLAGYVLRGSGWPRWARFMIKDWTYEDRGRAHQAYGKVFLVVSPAGLICYIDDPDTALTVCTRRKAFIKPPEKMKMLEPFGPNVVSTDGDLWKFHVRVTVPPLSDAVYRTVWAETLYQSGQLASRWAALPGGGNLRDGVYGLTVKVMSVAGFGQSSRQGEDCEDSGSLWPGHRLSLVQAVSLVVANLPLFLLLPAWLIQICAHALYAAYTELDLYMDELLAREKAAMGCRGEKSDSTATMIKARGNLLTAVIESNNQQPKDTSTAGSDPGGRTRLTDLEVKGNVFMFLLAGYDTTANTILYSIIVLALNGPVQDAVIAEIRRVYREAAAAGRSELSYDEDLPKFRYLLAFMHEVMRVFPIVIPITRQTITSQPLLVNDSKHTLPPQTLTIVNNTAIHHNPANWPHPHIIDPRRWLSTNPNTFDPTASLTEEQQAELCSHGPIASHRRGTFMTFNEGPRACLGRRFAQVEYVAFFARLLREHRVAIVDGLMDAAELEQQVRLRGGGAPVTLVPPVEVQVRLWVDETLCI